MNTPIQSACAAIREGTIDDFRELLRRHPEVLAEDGPLMFQHAAEYNRTDILELLLAAGMDINGPEGEDSPLAEAAGSASVETAQWLLDHGAHVDGNPADDWCNTPLQSAIQEGRLEMVTLLLDRGADPNILKGNPQRNALALARFWDQGDIADFLVSRGIDEIVIEPQPVDVEAESFLSLGKIHSADAWLDETWGSVYEFGIRNGLTSMCERNQVYFLVGYLITQLADGGTEGMYSNPSGEFAPLMVEALDKIGADRAARLIREINALFPDGTPAAENEQRWAQMEALPPEAEKLGQELEALFDEWTPNGGPRILVGQLHAYYRA